MKRTLSLALLLPFACAASAAFSSIAHAQQIDVAGGIASILAPKASQATGDHVQQSENGGDYVVASADFLFFKSKTAGVQGEFAFRENRGIYLPTELNLPFRPIFWDANAIWAPKITRRLFLEVMGGAGAQSTRFYTTSNYATSNHLMVDAGAGIKYYAWRHVFIRPEARLYVVNNNKEFSSSHVLRYGVSIGYTFKQKK